VDELTIQPPPVPKSPAEQRRWQHTRLRRRLLYGAWDRDLAGRLREQIGAVRAEAWGGGSSRDMSSNVFRVCATGLAALYSRWPTISHEDGAAGIVAAIEEAGLWPLMSRVQRDTLGLREMLIRVDVTTAGALTFRPVFPDMVLATSDADNPGQPVTIKEARQRLDPVSKKYGWAWDVIDISNPEAPVYKILGTDGSDQTRRYLGVDAMEGAAYPYRDNQDRPIQPYAIYHAAETATLWDPYEWRELLEGSLSASVYFNLVAHTMRCASWPQRWTIGCEVAGSGYSDEDGDGAGRSSIVTDPATVLMLRPSEDMAGQPTVGQWAPGADPQKLQETALAYEKRVATYAGVRASDILRQSGDPKSGYALSITRAAQREGQAAFEPMFRRADLSLIRIAAAMLNRANGSDLPEDGYRITYEGIPLSPEEMKAQREQLEKMLTLGLMDKAEAYQELHPGVSRGDAINRLAGIATFDTEMAALIAGDDPLTTTTAAGDSFTVTTE